MPLKHNTFQQQLAKFLIHPVTLLAIATVFATVAGVWLTNYYQSQAWMRDKRFEVFRQGHAEAIGLVDELSEAMSRRLFGLNRVVWVAKGTGTGELEQAWEAYYESVVDWNVQLIRDKGRLNRLIGPEMAETFASAQDAKGIDDTHPPTSIHGQFVVAHQKVRALVDCVRQRCQDQAKQAAVKDAEEYLNDLSRAVDRFIRTCTDRIDENESSS